MVPLIQKICTQFTIIQWYYIYTSSSHNLQSNSPEEKFCRLSSHLQHLHDGRQNLKNCFACSIKSLYHCSCSYKLTFWQILFWYSSRFQFISQEGKSCRVSPLWNCWKMVQSWPGRSLRIPPLFWEVQSSSWRRWRKFFLKEMKIISEIF